jgi:ribosomal protein L7/L12
MAKCVFCDQESPAGVSNCRLCGAPLPASESDSLRDDVFQHELLKLLSSGQRVQAVAAYGRRMGVNLDQALAAIEKLEQDRPFDVAPNDANLEWEIIAHLERGEKIGAIKLHRDRTGSGLKEAKDAVESIESRLGLGTPVNSGRGCLGMVVLLSVMVALIALS